jgi:TPR repeat
MKRLLIVTLILLIASPLLATEEYLQQGANHLASGNYKNAIRSYEAALKAKQDNAEAYKGIGLACYKLGNNEHYADPEKLSMALNAFEQSLAIKQDAEIYNVLGELYLYLDNKSAALQKYEILRSLDEEKAKLLASKIDAYKEPQEYKLIRTTTVITRKAYVEKKETSDKNRELEARLKDMESRIEDADSLSKYNMSIGLHGYVQDRFNQNMKIMGY